MRTLDDAVASSTMFKYRENRAYYLAHGEEITQKQCGRHIIIYDGKVQHSFGWGENPAKFLDDLSVEKRAEVFLTYVKKENEALVV